MGGRAVKVGPSGPPGGGALTAPWFQLSPATIGSGPPAGRSWLLWWWLDTADLTIAQHLGRGDRDARRPAIPSRWFAWRVRPQSERAHSNRRPRRKCGGHGDLELASWLCPSFSSGLPAQAADIAIPQPVEDQSEQFPGRRHLGDLDAGPSAAALHDTRKVGAIGSPPW